MALGERLRQQREKRGVTLEEIAQVTKIGSRSLRALEEEDFSKLPGGIFNKGFVRAYAHYLGIDEDDAVADYLAAVGDLADPALDSQRLKKLETTWNPSAPSDRSAPARVPWAALIILVLLVVAVFGAWHYRGRAAEHWRHWRARHSHAAQSSTGVTVPGSAPRAIFAVRIFR